jgi:putative transposase
MALGRILHGHRLLELPDSAVFSDDGAMEHRIAPGTVVEHAGKRWRVERVLGADSVLLRGEDGPPVAADPARVTFPDQAESAASLRPAAAMQCTEADWAEAVRRRDLVLRLAQQQDHPTAEIDAVARELGLKPRRVWQLLRLVRTRGPDIATFLPASREPRTKRLAPDVEAVIAQAIEQHYARPSRPSLLSLSREVDQRCTAGGLSPPSYEAVQARVRQCDRQWLTRRREGNGKARSMRLLTGAHPAAEAPWARVQIDSTPCDLCLVREADRTAIGRPTVTFALDLYSRTVLGFAVSLEGASTATTARCLEHACLPKDDWLAVRGLAQVRWPVWGKPAMLEYDQGPENEAAGVQRGLRTYGIEGKRRPVGHPEMHGTIERLIGTMMTQIHERRGTTFSNVGQRGDAKPAQVACLTLPELEQILALVVDTHHHTVHATTGERPIERYLAYYRRPDLSEAERVPPRLPARRFLLDFLPYERRALTRCGFRLFRIDYSSRDLLGMWRRDNGHRVMRVIAYDPRSLATIWALDEITGDYIAVPYRVPHPDMTLAESEEARRRLLALKAADRTERRLFENIAAIRAIEAQAKTTTARRKAERTRQAQRGAGEAATRLPRPDASVVPTLDDAKFGPSEATDAPSPAVVIEPFSDVAVL